MAYPIAPVVMPGDLNGQTNGRLSPGLLSPIDGGGKLHHLAARSWRALCDAAWREVGLPLTFTYGGDYRTYQQQLNLFLSRYRAVSREEWNATPAARRKTWTGAIAAGHPSIYWIKKLINGSYPATAATPGESNHGWALAVDCAWDRDLTDGIGPDDATGITSHPGWSWLLANAHRFGFSWELQSEPWHLRYVAGDMVPVETLTFENPTPQPPPTQEDDDDMAAIEAIYEPNDLVKSQRGGKDAKTFLLRGDGGIRHAQGPDVLHAQAKNVPVYPIEGTAHYDKLDEQSEQG